MECWAKLGFLHEFTLCRSFSILLQSFPSKILDCVSARTEKQFLFWPLKWQRMKNGLRFPSKLIFLPLQRCTRVLHVLAHSKRDSLQKHFFFFFFRSKISRTHLKCLGLCWPVSIKPNSSNSSTGDNTQCGCYLIPGVWQRFSLERCGQQVRLSMCKLAHTPGLAKCLGFSQFVCNYFSESAYVSSADLRIKEHHQSVVFSIREPCQYIFRVVLCYLFIFYCAVCPDLHPR